MPFFCRTEATKTGDHLENVVLDGAREELLVNTLLLGGHDVKGEDGQHGAVHGHGHGHFVERDAIKERLVVGGGDATKKVSPVQQKGRGRRATKEGQAEEQNGPQRNHGCGLPGAPYFHVLDRVDSDAGHAHVANHTLVVRVVSTVRGQVKGDAEALLSRGQVGAVEAVALLHLGVGKRSGERRQAEQGRCNRPSIAAAASLALFSQPSATAGWPAHRAKAGVLADGPGAGRVHGGVGATRVGVDARVLVGHVGDVLLAVDGLELDALAR